MAKRKRRNFTPEFKAEVVLEALRGESSQAELCRRHNLSTRSQNGSSSSLEMRPLCLPPRISNPARQPSGSHTLSTSLDG